MRHGDCSLFAEVSRLMVKICAVFLVVLFLLSGTASAANWVYLQRQEGTRYGPCTEYIDSNSVVETNEKVTYWTIWVFDEQSKSHNIMKILWKHEAALPDQPPQYRLLERYYFNAENEEIKRHLEPVKDYGNSADEVRRVLGYAKAGPETSTSRPDHVVTPTPKWYGIMSYDDCDLYWDVHSIVSWPQDKPTAIDIRVKQVWNDRESNVAKPFSQLSNPILGTIMTFGAPC